MSSTTKLREHLFISYAWEDGALAEWLTLRLTAEGYRVWCDRFKILGGERWPDDIDEAIRHQTFRMLHLVSRYSLNKPNPKKERELALQLERERRSELLVPLNVDGTKPSDLPWRLVDVAYIPFENWSDGIGALLKKLAAIDAPRPLAESGRGIAATALLVEKPIVENPEQLVSNVFRFTSVPSAIHAFDFSRELVGRELARLHESWVFRSLGGKAAVAFGAPPAGELPENVSLTEAEKIQCAEGVSIRGVASMNVLTELLRKSLDLYLGRRGLRRDSSGLFHFPLGLLERNKLPYSTPTGRRSSILACGERTFKGTRYRYYLAPQFHVQRDVTLGFVATLRLRVHVTDRRGRPFDERGIVARRKNIGRAWWNQQWLSRQRAVTAFVTEGMEQVEIGDEVAPVTLRGQPMSGTVARAIDEALLEQLRAPVSSPPADSERDEDEE